MSQEDLKDLVLQKIGLFIDEIKKRPNYIAYEGDLVCRLYWHLCSIPALIQFDEEGDIPLHSETPTEANPREFFDLLVFDNENNPLIAIECKFNEFKWGTIEHDFEKLSKAGNMVSLPIFILIHRPSTPKFKKKFKSLSSKFSNVRVFFLEVEGGGL